MAFSNTGNGTLNPFKIGITGTGTATINGGTDVVRGYLWAGLNSGSNGTVTVTGTGSSLTLSGANPEALIGISGTGTLNVAAGALLNSYRVELGTQFGGNGTLNTTGAGSKVVLSNDDLSTGSDYGGSLAVGRVDGATGTLNMSGGAVLEIRNSDNENAPGLNFGRNLGATGVGTVSGNGTAINISQTGGSNQYAGGPFFQVGRMGQGTFTLSNNAQVNITGPYGFFRVSRGNNEGDPGAPALLPQGVMSILSGADVTLTAVGGSYYGALARVGGQTNANGRLVIDGNGSRLTVHGDNLGTGDDATAQLSVGHGAKGELVMTNGADVLIDGGDDGLPYFGVGTRASSEGTATLSGVGTTLVLVTDNTEDGRGGFVAVGRQSGSNGVLTISNGAQLINDLNSNNSTMGVGSAGAYSGQPGSQGTVTVNGSGDASTLLDAGNLLLIGAEWNFTGSSLSDVNFGAGGTGAVTVLNGATVRADDIAVGIGGRISGNATFEGDVTVTNGVIDPGPNFAKLKIDGDLDATSASLKIGVRGLTAGTGHDQLQVTGAVSLTDVTIELATDAAFDFSKGDRLKLIDGAASATDVGDASLKDNAVSGDPATLAYLLSSENGDLYFEALNSGSGKAIVAFGASSTVGATASIGNSVTGVGSGSGGRLDGVDFVRATGLDGTAAADSFTASGSKAVTLRGLGGNDSLSGGNGGDKLDGGLANDTIIGNGGADKITGGAGTDTMTGGAGKETYFFKAKADSAVGANRDVITDFSQSDRDVIHLAKIDAKQSVAANNAFTFTASGGTADFKVGVEGKLRWENVGGDTLIQVETNGDGVADFEIMLSGTYTLTALDFIL